MLLFFLLLFLFLFVCLFVKIKLFSLKTNTLRLIWWMWNEKHDCCILCLPSDRVTRSSLTKLHDSSKKKMVILLNEKKSPFCTKLNFQCLHFFLYSGLSKWTHLKRINLVHNARQVEKCAFSSDHKCHWFQNESQHSFYICFGCIFNFDMEKDATVFGKFKALYRIFVYSKLKMSNKLHGVLLVYFKYCFLCYNHWTFLLLLFCFLLFIIIHSWHHWWCLFAISIVKWNKTLLLITWSRIYWIILVRSHSSCWKRFMAASSTTA